MYEISTIDKVESLARQKGWEGSKKIGIKSQGRTFFLFGINDEVLIIEVV